MNRHPGLRVSIESVQRGIAIIHQSIKIVDQCDAAVLVGVLCYGQDIFRFRQVVSVVAVGQDLRRGVSNPSLIDIGVNLIAGRYLRKPAALRQILGGVFVSLVAIEDANGNANVEAIAA